MHFLEEKRNEYCQAVALGLSEKDLNAMLHQEPKFVQSDGSILMFWEHLIVALKLAKGLMPDCDYGPCPQDTLRELETLFRELDEVFCDNTNNHIDTSRPEGVYNILLKNGKMKPALFKQTPMRLFNSYMQGVYLGAKYSHWTEFSGFAQSPWIDDADVVEVLSPFVGFNKLSPLSLDGEQLRQLLLGKANLTEDFGYEEIEE